LFGRKKKKTSGLPALNSRISLPKNRSGATKTNHKGRPDWPILAVAVFLTLFGLLMIFSASAFLSLQNKDFNYDLFYIFNRHIIWIIIGTVLAFIIYKMPILSLRKLSIVAIFVLLAIMIYMVPEALSSVIDVQTGRKAIELPLVNTLNNGTRWIDLGIFDMQPAEFIKIPIIIFSAYWFTLGEKEKKRIDDFLKKYKDKEFLHLILSTGAYLIPFIILGLIVLLVLTQRDLDSAVVIALPVIAIYFAATTSKQQVYTLLGILFVGFIAGYLLITQQDYRKERFDAYTQIIVDGQPDLKVQADNGYQAWNGLIAIGSGGLFGKGYNESRQKFYYLQEAAYTDSIFAVTAEEFGLAGSLAIMLGFLYLGSRGFKNAAESSSKFESLIIIGITTWIISQAFLNIAANLSLIPFAGMPLPFFSYGGSNTLMILLGIGLMLKLSRKNISSRDNPLFRRRV